jgi:dihydroflavonol-4-reductase
MEPDRSFWREKNVCVTGGTGLLGYHIVKILLDSRARVRVLALPPHQQHPLHQEARVDLVFGDVREPRLVQRCLADRDLIFHTAGVVAVWGPSLQRVRDVHIKGTRNVLAAAPRATRVVLTSSVVTVGASKTAEPLTEDSPFRPDGLKIDYIHAKRAAEQIALEGAAAGRDVVVTNPGYLIGPEDYERSIMGRFCTRFWRGLIPVAPPGGLNLADVRDIARGHLLAAEHGRSGRRYILGGENRSFPEFMALLARIGGLKPRAIPSLPCWALTVIAGCAECRSLLTREQPYPSLQHSRLNRYYWYYRSDRARRELGYQNRPLADCLAETYRWYCSHRRFRVRGAARWWIRPGIAADWAA